MVDGGMAAAIPDSQARHQPRGLPAAAGAVLGPAAGGTHHFAADPEVAIYPEARQPRPAADWVHRIGVARHAGVGVHQQSIRRADGHSICRRRLRFHLPLGGGEDRPSLSLLPPGLLQWAFFTGDDGRLPCAVAARLLRTSLGDSSGHDTSVGRHLYRVPGSAAHHAGSKVEQSVTDDASWIVISDTP